MSNFKSRRFSECDVNDPFFNGLKEDYDDFTGWFSRKSTAGESAYVCFDDGIQAFLYLKENEDEEIPGVLPKERRIKIGTLKISEGSQEQRLGEGAMGIALWRWQQSDVMSIYVTVLPKHERLIRFLQLFGFVYTGMKEKEEAVYLKDKRKLDYGTAKLSFPYLNPNLSRGKYIPINDDFHDKLFQYSELKNVKRDPEEDALAASNGLCKVYIATPSNDIDYCPGDIAIIYRKHTGEGPKKYKSVATSFCTIQKQTPIKTAMKYVKSQVEFNSIVGNKSVYSKEELDGIYRNASTKNLIVIEMIYNGFFGAGHNVTYDALDKEDLFNEHPYKIQLTREDVLKIIKMGGKREQDIIIDQPGAC